MHVWTTDARIVRPGAIEVNVLVDSARFGPATDHMTTCEERKNSEPILNSEKCSEPGQFKNFTEVNNAFKSCTIKITRIFADVLESIPEESPVSKGAQKRDCGCVPPSWLYVPWRRRVAGRPARLSSRV